MCIRDSYSTRVQDLEEWLSKRGYPELALLRHEHERLLDGLKEYIQGLYEASRPVTWGTDLLAGVQYYYPQLAGRLTEVWNMQRQWHRLHPGQFRVPMPMAVLLALCTLAWHWSWRRVSASLLLAYHLMLRPAELTSALRMHLVLPCDLS
eukprot:5118367-Amphidinium_carterae.1